MSKIKKVYNKQYKDIEEAEVKITNTDNNHTNLKDANLMLDVRIPVTNKKLTLNDVVDMINNLSIAMDNGFAKVNARLDKLEDRLDNIVKKNNLIE